MSRKISFVTNATPSDGIRLKVFLPHVLEAFDGCLDELLVIVDHRPEEGRIRTLHQHHDTPIVPLEEIINTYSSELVRFENLDYSVSDDVSEKWFGRKGIVRCQNGTPIFAFLYGIERARNVCILRSDCDILFYDTGFVNTILDQAGQFDLMQLPFLNDTHTPFSTRCFFINRDRMFLRLPLLPHTLDLLRRLHRYIQGRAPYLALEQILELEIQRGQIFSQTLPTRLGYTMHIPTRADFKGIEEIVHRFCLGKVPSEQLRVKHDYIQRFWR